MGPSREFAVHYSGPQGTITQTFTPEDDSLFSHVNWVSTSGCIVVIEGVLGWNAYLQPGWRRVHWWGYRTKELAAFSGCVASLNDRSVPA